MQRAIIHSLLVACVMILFAQPCLARIPILKQQFRFDPGDSLFTVSGGFMGVDYAYSLEGTFVININPRLHTAWFSHVDATITSFHTINDDSAPSFPSLFLGSDLDEVLNLSGLHGKIDTTNHAIAFKGYDSQGAPLAIDVTLNSNPWRVFWPYRQSVNLKGQNHPPCCDFFNFGIDADAVRRPWFYPYMPGDLDGDARVTLLDLVTLGDNYNKSFEPDVEKGDFDGDGRVDLLDLVILGDNYGAGTFPIPEPATLSILAMAALIAINRRS